MTTSIAPADVLDDDGAREELESKLQQFVGRYVLEPTQAADEVNQAMIRHWVEAMGDENPIYTDDQAAKDSGRDGVVAPPTMIQAWAMRGYKKHVSGGSSGAMSELIELLNSAGLVGVVATDNEQTYERELVPGDVITAEETIGAVSPLKKTALGDGYFFTHDRVYTDQNGDVVATQTWRMLRFRPVKKAAAAPAESNPPVQRPLRPRPAVNKDLEFWFEAAKEHKLLIQKGTTSGELRHPPGPMDPTDQSLEWETVEASGKGTVYSFTVAHHPKLPAFDYPLIIALVELEEGTRLVTNLVDIEPEDISIGMPVELTWIDADDELTLPAFRPAGVGN